MTINQVYTAKRGTVSRPPRVLAVHRYYWPDTPPYASMLRDIVGQWAADGFDVEVLSTSPSYKRGTAPSPPFQESGAAVKVQRLDLPREHGRRWLVPLNIAVFSFFVAMRILLTRRRFDVVMTSTAPPVVLAWAASRAARARGGKFVYHCMDIHPEIGRVSGEFGSPLVFRLLQRLDRVTCSTAAAVVVLSSDMANTLRRRRPSQILPIHEINNFELGESGATASTMQTRADDMVIRIVFTGNLGRFQGLETVVAALGKLQRARVHLTFMGAGSALDSLRRQAAELPPDQVTFLPHQGVDAARTLIASADLGLVSLTGGIYKFAYPSKTMTYLAEGCPVLAVVEPDCELVTMLHREGLGISVPPDDAEVLAATLDAFADDPASLATLGATARSRGASIFDKAQTLKKWSILLETVVEAKVA